MTENYMNNGVWMQTFSGVKFHPLSPIESEINIEDIAHSLAYQCRFAGHTRRYYSVAEHSYNVSICVSSQYALAGLLHDAAEAYLVDVPRPVKPSLGGYKEIEAGLYAAIARRFGLPEQIPEAVKEIDNRILLDERDSLLGPSPADKFDGWPDHLEPLGLMPSCWSPDAAELNFLCRFQELTAIHCPVCGSELYGVQPVNSHYETTCCRQTVASCCEGPVSTLP